MSSDCELDQQLLNRAIELAMQGRGFVEPNPMVGCVIVRNGKIIGEGYHRRFGGPHAEPNALAAAGSGARGASVYVTLEPCCHTDKKTPPCVPRLIEAGVARVVVGCRDPNPKVAGRGVEQLREAGIAVTVLDNPECRQLIAPFIALTIHQRPYVTLKWAQTADRKVAGPAGRRMKISNERSHRLIHELRAKSDGILVGIGTVLKDDPLLTARRVPNVRPLARIVLDSDLRLPTSSRLAQTTDLGKVIAFCSKEAAEYSGTRVLLAAMGVEIHPVSSDAPGRLNLAAIVAHLGKLGLTHLLVEPGPTLAKSFFASGLVDRVWVFESPIRVDDNTAPEAPDVTYPAVARADVGADRLIEYLNPNSPLFFQSSPSVDFPRSIK
jgi:diaminohydroxyphosphoribosylaminopyrimidine deaminase / 5-amino-6-(5-phosphoribosylamino)uracil reductase